MNKKHIHKFVKKAINLASKLDAAYDLRKNYIGTITEINAEEVQAEMFCSPLQTKPTSVTFQRDYFPEQLEVGQKFEYTQILQTITENNQQRTYKGKIFKMQK